LPIKFSIHFFFSCDHFWEKHLSCPFIRRFSRSREKRLFALSRTSVHASLRMYQRGTHWADFRKIWYWGRFGKICREVPNLVTIGHLVWKPRYVLLLLATFKSPQKPSAWVKCFQAVRVVEEVQILRERATALRCSLFPISFHAL
jgi:hypothetical protein